MRDPRLPRRRLMLLLAGLLVWAAAIAFRLVDIQIYRAADLRELARRQQSSIVEVDPVRGAIRDRFGSELALSRDVHSVYAIPRAVADPTAAAPAIARIIGGRSNVLLARLRQTDRDFVWLARKVTDEQAAAIEALQLTGIAFRLEPKRYYPRGELAAHVLGYAGLDNVGLAGLEQQFEHEIRGVPGVELNLLDGRRLRVRPEHGGLPAEPGLDLVLTLDATIQYIVERELARVFHDHRARGAVAVVLDPSTGDVLAMAGQPTFDPNRYARAPPPVRRNPAVQEAYEPGSTFKIMSMSAALEQGLVDPHERIDCGRGGVTVGGRRIRDHESFDILTASEVIAHSSNVGAIRIGVRVPPMQFYEQLRRFGFAQKTGIDLPGESPGLLTRPEQWSKLTQSSISMGQEVGVTPLQLASAFAAVANGGTLMRPRIWLRLEAADGTVVRESKIEAVGRVVTTATAHTMVEMMRTVVTDGTGTRSAIDGVAVAGKTGTAQKIIDGTYANGRYVASFAAFAPAAAPRVVIVVAVDEPRAGPYHGGQVAAPAVRAMLEPILEHLGEGSTDRVIAIPLIDYFPAAPPPPADLLDPTVVASR